MKQFIATKGLIVYQDKILVLRESSKYEDGTNANKFDVVGGRLEAGERFDEALVREVKEETGLDVKVGEPFFVSEWRPNVRGEDWQVVGIFFRCEADSDIVTLSVDHDAYLWINPNDYKESNIIQNLYPIIEKYIEKFC